MWPWGHLAVGYLVYSAYQRARFDCSPRDKPILALFLGTQFPDLVDKPLALTFGVLPSGRSFAHSLIVTVLVIAGLRLLVQNRRQITIMDAFSIGYLTHLLADAIQSLVATESASLAFLVWPILPLVYPSTDHSILDLFRSIEVTPFFVFQLALVVLAFGFWLRDDTPGLAALKRVPLVAYRRLLVKQ